MERKKLEQALDFNVHPDFVLVYPKKQKDKSDGGVLLSEGAQKEMATTPTAEVLDIGDNIKLTFGGKPLMVGDEVYIRADQHMVQVAEINGFGFGFAFPAAILGVKNE